MKATFRHIAALIFAVFATLQVTAVDPNTDEDPYFLLMGEADKAIAECNYDEAAARLIDALGVDPTNPSNLLVKTNLGMVYSCQGKDSLAIATLSDVIDIAPNMTAAIYNRGRINLKINRNTDAYNDFGRVIDIDSLHTDARYFRGMMALYDGKRDVAEDDFNVLLGTRPDDLRTLTAVGTLYSMTGREREATRYLKRVIDADPAAEYYAALAGCYLAMDELSEASSTIADGLKLYPKDPELYYYRAWLNRERFRLDDARDDARLAIRYGASPAKVKALFEQ